MFNRKADHYKERRYDKNLMESKPSFKPLVSKTLYVKDKETDEVHVKTLNQTRVGVPRDPAAFASYLMKEGAKV